MQIAMPTLSTDHRRRGGLPLASTLSLIRLHQRDNPRADLPAHLLARLINLLAFLDRWPRLEWSHAWQHWQLAGKLPRAGNAALPGSDHTAFWRVAWVRGPIVATTFPYRWTDDMHAEAQAFAARHGLAVEVRPSDMPDLWMPGQTVPVVWSRAGIDWRQLAASAPGAPGAPSGAVPEPSAPGATAAPGAPGAPQGVWGGAARTLHPALVPQAGDTA